MYVQVGMQLDSDSSLGTSGAFIPVPRRWLKPSDMGGVFTSVYPTSVHGGIVAARSLATLMLPSFSLPGFLRAPGGRWGGGVMGVGAGACVRSRQWCRREWIPCCDDASRGVGLCDGSSGWVVSAEADGSSVMAK